MKEGQPELLVNKKDSKINIKDNKDSNKQRREEENKQLTVVHEKDTTPKKSAGSSAINQVRGADQENPDVSLKSKYQEVSFAINKQGNINERIESKALVINISSQSNKANNYFEFNLH